jgi:hypothetical protein
MSVIARPRFVTLTRGGFEQILGRIKRSAEHRDLIPRILRGEKKGSADDSAIAADNGRYEDLSNIVIDLPPALRCSTVADHRER